MGKNGMYVHNPAVKTAGYHNPMPTALICAVRHMIGVASQFIGWVLMDTYKWETEPRSGEKSAGWLLLKEVRTQPFGPLHRLPEFPIVYQGLVAGQKHIGNAPAFVFCGAGVDRRSQQVVLEAVG